MQSLSHYWHVLKTKISQKLMGPVRIGGVSFWPSRIGMRMYDAVFQTRTCQYPVPESEKSRLEAVRELQILDTPAEERFDRLTQRLKQSLDVPIVLISVLDSNRQWYKSVQGLNIIETPREMAFCNLTIMRRQILMIEDTAHDPRTCDNPVVKLVPKIRFYAGYPLRAPGGELIGTLCAMDFRPRSLEIEKIENFKDLAALVEKEIQVKQLSEAQLSLTVRLAESKQLARLDALTHMWNRRGILEVLEKELAVAVRGGGAVGVAMADIDHFKKINDTYGHGAGDEILQGISQRIRQAIRPSDAAGRFGGEEFLLIFSRFDPKDAPEIAARICRQIRSEPFIASKVSVPVTLSLGMTCVEKPAQYQNQLPVLIKMVDKALYMAKQRGRDQAVLL